MLPRQSGRPAGNAAQSPPEGKFKGRKGMEEKREREEGGKEEGAG